ncbi:cysteine--tRNA ligase [Pararhizobium sp. IMCC21322]|uniref:cysteine--tRNA ligase n=1 Tax=Pararhizobium sp. IMCC21322 TaxID=3067903 RepID=UPI00274252E9|nr:cysteine--tRNA ligase [Pararhizobium sp. IMCC21322]
MNKLPDLWLYNTLTRKKERFQPLDPANVRLYVCGPTVYDYAHIGNARPIIVFDVLFRLLRHLYGPEHVTYARNITDVDDKINARAAKEGVSIEDVTRRTTVQFHKDIAALGVLEPTVEPRATDHIEEMKALIEQLIERGHAYVADDHVLFDVSSMVDYGQLSKRPLDEMIAGARVEVASYKKNPTDFVLWKPSKTGEPSWVSPADISVPGRPGWHIECSAMSAKHLGEVFDIHGGGIDLAFPHHENEVAQSRCAYGTDTMANFWMHNGFVQVEGEKMSKSLGNFITINDLLETEKFGGRKWHGRILRLAMLKTHYEQPIDWTVSRLLQADRQLKKWTGILAKWGREVEGQLSDESLAALADNLNMNEFFRLIARYAERASFDRLVGVENIAFLKGGLEFLGFNLLAGLVVIKVDSGHVRVQGHEVSISHQINPQYAGDTVTKADLSDAPRNLNKRIEDRLRLLGEKNWAEADRIRDALLGEGIQLKDGKNPDTGARETKWEIKR